MADNAFSDLIPGGAKKPSGNAFADLIPGGASKTPAMGPTLAPAMVKPSSLTSVLDAPRKATMAGLAQRAAQRGLTTPAAAANDPTEAYTRAWFTPEIYDKSPGWMRGLERGFIDTINDPLMAAQVAADPLAPVVKAAIGKVAERAPQLAAQFAAKAPKTAAALAPVVRDAKKVAGSLHDFFTFGGEAKRTIGVPKTQEILGAAERIGRRVGPQGRLAHMLTAKVERAAKGLSPEEIARVSNALQGFVNPADLTTKEDNAYRIFDATRKRLATLSDIAKKMDPTMMTPERMTGWIPLPPTERELAEGLPKRTQNTLEGFDPHILERRAPATPIRPQDSKAALEAWKSAIKSKGSLLQGKALTREVKRILGSSISEPVRKMFDVQIPATGAQRSGREIAGDVYNAVKSAPKTAVVGTMPGHIANMLGLAAAQPGGGRAIAEAATNVPKEWQAMAGGMVGERTTPLIDLAKKYLPPVGAYMGGVNRATWTVDRALEDAFAKQFREGGANPDRALQMAREAMIDYSHPSPFTEGLKKVAPFGTFHAGMVKPIVKGVARAPGRAALLNRATGGAFYGSDTDTGTPLGKVRSLLPAAAVGRAIGSGPEAMKELRNTITPLAEIPAAVGEKWMHPKERYPFWSRGLDPTKPADLKKLALQLLLSPVPESQEALGAFGQGAFTPDSWQSEVLRQATRTLPLK